MNLEITKKDFDTAVPAAKEPKGKIFEALQGSIEEQKYFIEAELLGIPGVTVVDTGEDAAAERLRRFVKQLVCVSAFVGGMRGLDLVLTATGFGVVSTQDTAPASKMRVDALEGELRGHHVRVLFDKDAILRAVGKEHLDQGVINLL